MIVRVCAAAIVIALTACAFCLPLSPDEAARLADQKARTFRPKLAEYQRSPGTYEIRDNAWWFHYHPYKMGSRDFFDVIVYVKTKEAFIVESD